MTVQTNRAPSELATKKPCVPRVQVSHLPVALYDRHEGPQFAVGSGKACELACDSETNGQCRNCYDYDCQRGTITIGYHLISNDHGCHNNSQ